MQVAKIENGAIAAVDDHRAMFPNVSFPPTGPSEQFMEENNIVYVNSFIDHNPNVQRLISVEPYISEGVVYNVAVQIIPEGELYAIAQAQQAQLVASFTDSAQQHLDAFAKTRGYDGIMSAATYINSTIPRYAAEATRALLLRDQWWSTLDTIMVAVLSEQRPVPASFDEILSELPALTWE